MRFLSSNTRWDWRLDFLLGSYGVVQKCLIENVGTRTIKLFGLSGRYNLSLYSNGWLQKPAR